MRSFLLGSTIFGIAILSGCASLTPGSSRETDVIAHFGKPAEERRLPNNIRQLDFPRAPMGYENWRVTLSADGTVQTVEQLLDEAHFRKLQPGMSMDEVKGALGRPAELNAFPRLAEQVLSWRFMEPGRGMFFNAHFDASGRLKYTSRSEELIPQNDGSSP